ncbi:TPA: hypothetical protein ACXKGV_002782 [Klebsiella oxytoca]
MGSRCRSCQEVARNAVTVLFQVLHTISGDQEHNHLLRRHVQIEFLTVQAAVTLEHRG